MVVESQAVKETQATRWKGCCARGAAVALLAVAAFAAVPAGKAQDAAPSSTGETVSLSIEIQIAPPSSSNAFFMSGIAGPLGARPVTGKPLAAEIVTRHKHAGQGGEVSRSTTSEIYRDAEGRIRRESQLSVPGLPPDAAPFSYITIVDQQKGCGWYLDPQELVAHRYALNGAGLAYMAQVSVRGSRGELLPQPGEATADAPAGAAEGGTHPALRATSSMPIAMMPAAAGEAHPSASPGAHGGAGVPEMRINQPFLAAPHPVRIENLGEELILGVRAHGTRIVTTVPAGELGNDKPIDIVSEQWYAPELQLVMRSMHSDPWGGEIDTNVTKLTQGDQPESRFQVPDSYKIVDSANDPEHRVLDVRTGHAPGMHPW